MARGSFDPSPRETGASRPIHQRAVVRATRARSHSEPRFLGPLPPDSAMIGYATEDPYLCSSVHSRCQRPPEGVGTNKTVGAIDSVEVTLRAKLQALVYDVLPST